MFTEKRNRRWTQEAIHGIVWSQGKILFSADAHHCCEGHFPVASFPCLPRAMWCGVCGGVKLLLLRRCWQATLSPPHLPCAIVTHSWLCFVFLLGVWNLPLNGSFTFVCASCCLVICLVSHAKTSCAHSPSFVCATQQFFVQSCDTCATMTTVLLHCNAKRKTHFWSMFQVQWFVSLQNCVYDFVTRAHHEKKISCIWWSHGKIACSIISQS